MTKTNNTITNNNNNTNIDNQENKVIKMMSDLYDNEIYTGVYNDAKIEHYYNLYKDRFKDDDNFYSDGSRLIKERIKEHFEDNISNLELYRVRKHHIIKLALLEVKLMALTKLNNDIENNKINVNQGTNNNNQETNNNNIDIGNTDNNINCQFEIEKKTLKAIIGLIKKVYNRKADINNNVIISLNKHTIKFIIVKDDDTYIFEDRIDYFINNIDSNNKFDNIVFHVNYQNIKNLKLDTNQTSIKVNIKNDDDNYYISINETKFNYFVIYYNVANYTSYSHNLTTKLIMTKKGNIFKLEFDNILQYTACKSDKYMLNNVYFDFNDNDYLYVVATDGRRIIANKNKYGNINRRYTGGNILIKKSILQYVLKSVINAGNEIKINIDGDDNVIIDSYRNSVMITIISKNQLNIEENKNSYGCSYPDWRNTTVIDDTNYENNIEIKALQLRIALFILKNNEKKKEKKMIENEKVNLNINNKNQLSLQIMIKDDKQFLSKPVECQEIISLESVSIRNGYLTSVNNSLAFNINYMIDFVNSFPLDNNSLIKINYNDNDNKIKMTRFEFSKNDYINNNQIIIMPMKK